MLMSNFEYEITGGAVTKMSPERISLHEKGYFKAKDDKMNITQKEFYDSTNETAATIEQNDRGDDMNSETFNTFFKDIKDDMREREERSRREITEREQRFEKQMQQFMADAKERELRINQSVNELKEDFKETKKEIRETSKYIKSLSITTIIAMVTTVAAIAGIAITIFLSLQ